MGCVMWPHRESVTFAVSVLGQPPALRLRPVRGLAEYTCPLCCHWALVTLAVFRGQREGCKGHDRPGKRRVNSLARSYLSISQ